MMNRQNRMNRFAGGFPSLPRDRLAKSAPHFGEPPGVNERQEFDRWLRQSKAPHQYAEQPGNVLRFGARAGAAAAINTQAIQAAIDSGRAVYIPNGEFEISTALLLKDETTIYFESRDAVIKGNLTGALLKSATAETARIFNVAIHGGKIDNTARTNAGAIALDLRNMTMTKVFGTLITNVETGVRINAPVSGGAYYNEFHGVDISGCDIGYEYGSLGNENAVFGGRVNDSEIGARLNDCTGDSFHSCAFEVFANYGVDVAPTTAVQYTKIIACRFENVGGVGTGIRISANGQATSRFANQFTGLATAVDSARFDGAGHDDRELVIRALAVGQTQTPIIGHQRATATLNFGSIAAGATAELTITMTGALTTDSVFVTPPSTLEAGLVCSAIPAVDGVIVRIANVTAGAIDPASATFTADAWRH